MKLIALIYCRVSSERQANEGHGLDSQEHRCRQFAIQNGYEVEKVFHDTFSGGGDFLCRPAMRDMLAYVDGKPHQEYVVIFDDLKRFARDTIFHWSLRAALKARNVIPKCLNYNFDDSPEGTFVETVFAAQNQLDREQNRRQVIQKQKARLEAGYWPFNPIPGYVSKKIPGHGKVLHFTERATVIKEALEGYASGRLVEKVDVQKFLQLGKYHGTKTVYLTAVDRLFSRASICAGYVEYEPWEVSRRIGHHEAMISVDTLRKIEDRLKGGTRKMARLDINPDFPARGYVLCADCYSPMTASWTTKPKKNYRRSFYRCTNKTCIRYNKSTSGDLLDKRIEELLKSIKPRKQIVELSKVILNDIWKQKNKEQSESRHEVELKQKQLETQIDDLLLRATRSNNDTVVKEYEGKIEKLSLEKKKLSEVTWGQGSLGDFGTALNTVVSFLESPYYYWSNGGVNEKRLVLKLAFSGKLPYHFENGFGTTEMCCVLKVFEQVASSKSLDVEMARIELACKRCFRGNLQSLSCFISPKGI